MQRILKANPVTLPNFLVIGAAKAGTTSLQHYLSQHPDIYLASKELNYFAYTGQKARFRDRNIWKATTLKRYRAYFQAVTCEQAVGEISPRYLHTPVAPENIFRRLPQVKLLAILHAPTDQAYSYYRMCVRIGKEKRTFRQALDDEISGAHTANDERYIFAGYYYQHLLNYYKLFDGKQLSIHLYEDLRDNPRRLMADIFEFLGVNEDFVPDLSRSHNIADGSTDAIYPVLLRQSALSSELRAWLPPWVGERWSAFTQKFQKPRAPVELQSMDPEVRAFLTAHYRKDILQLQDMLGRDLSAWL